jgi:hypothetical protein
MALGVVFPSTGLLLSQIGHPVTVSPQSILVLVAVAVLGATYGALVELPPAMRLRVTSSAAD